jgi:hypothetical protein
MLEKMKKGKAMRSFWRHLCFGAFGVTALIDVENPFNPVNIIFGVIVGILFGILCKLFLSGVVGSFNRDIKEEHGKQIVSYAVGKGLTYMVPFATIAVLSTFLLGWSITSGVVSAGLMTAGVATSLEVDKIKGTTSTKNSLTATVVCGGFALLWTFAIGFIAKLPPYIEGGIQLLGSFAGNLFN